MRFYRYGTKEIPHETSPALVTSTVDLADSLFLKSTSGRGSWGYGAKDPSLAPLL
jgi:hypothetical protein